MYSECAPQSSERVCVIYGPLEIVVQAVKAVLFLITGFPLKGPNMLYDPRHYDQYLSPMYGGFSDPSAPQGGPPGAGPLGGIPSIAPPPPPQSNVSQRNPYFQPPSSIPPSALGGSDGLSQMSGRRGITSRGNSFSLHSGGTSSSSRGIVSGYGNQHHQSGLLSPLNGPRGVHYPKGSAAAAMMDPDQADLFTPDFGGTFTGGAMTNANIPWSSARSYASSRRSSVSAGTPGGGLDLFSPRGGDIDWFNYPGKCKPILDFIIIL